MSKDKFQVDDDEDIEEALRLELLRRDHEFICAQIGTIDVQIRQLQRARGNLERQLAANEAEWR